MNVPLNVHICGRCVRVDDGEGCFTVGTPEPRVRVDLVLSMQLELDCFALIGIIIAEVGKRFVCSRRSW